MQYVLQGRYSSLGNYEIWGKLRGIAKEETIGFKNRLVRFSLHTWLYKSAFSSFPGNQSKTSRRIKNKSCKLCIWWNKVKHILCRLNYTEKDSKTEVQKENRKIMKRLFGNRNVYSLTNKYTLSFACGSDPALTMRENWINEMDKSSYSHRAHSIVERHTITK